MRNKLLITIALLFLILFNFGCRTQKITYVATQSVQVKNISYPDATLLIELNLHNPNRYKFIVNDLESDLFINKNAMGKITLAHPIQVPAKSDFTLPVQLKVGIGKALQQALQLLGHSGKEPIWIALKGKAQFQKRSLKMNYPIDYEGFQTLKFNQ